MSIDHILDRLARAAVEGKSPTEQWADRNRPSKLQALKKAEVFRRINEENGTNEPLPAWIQAAIGEQY